MVFSSDQASRRSQRKRPWQQIWTLMWLAPKLLSSKQVPRWEKAIFGGAVLLYWIIPDVIPFMPLDDVIFTLVLMPWFSKRALKYEQPN